MIDELPRGWARTTIDSVCDPVSKRGPDGSSAGKSSMTNASRPGSACTNDAGDGVASS